MNTQPRIGFFGLVAGACICAGLTGCIVVCGNSFDDQSCAATFHADRSRSVACVSNQAIDVVNENGAITINEGSGTEVVIRSQIHAISQERLDATLVTAEQKDDGMLLIRVRWPDDHRASSELVNLSVTVPNLRAAQAKTSNGSVVIEHVSGAVDAGTSNGPITIRECAGPVKAHTSNGAVSVELSERSPGPVNIETSNGRVALTVGPGFCGTVDAKTSNGSLENHGGGSTVESGRGWATWNFGPGPASTIKSSNGSISIHRR